MGFFGGTCGQRAEGEGAADIGCLRREGKADLGAGAAHAAQDVRAQVCAEDIRQLAGDDLRLVVAAPPSPRPVQRDGDDYIHVRELRRGGQALAQHPGEEPPGRQTALVLQVPRDVPEVRVGVVEEQRGGKGIRLVET